MTTLARKNPLLAFVMSCVAAGWGLVYVGRVKWGVWVAAALYGGVALMGLCGLLASPMGVLLFLLWVLSIKLASAIAAAITASRNSDGARYPSTRMHLLYLAGLVVLTLVMFEPLRPHLLGFKTYYVPSGSMIPTLDLGDYIVSDLRPGPVKVGDIVVHRYNGTEMVKRVAAVAGDTLAIVDGNVLVNGRNLGLFFAPPERARQGYSQHLAALQVEPGHVYLLGDNRDNSNDSRFMGQVAESDITGRITGIWLAPDRSRIGTRFD